MSKVSNSIVITSRYPEKENSGTDQHFSQYVYREISRNTDKRGYSAAIAREYCDIHKECHKQKRKLTPSMEKYIREKITTDQWSPKQICGQAKLTGRAMVSHERIYQLIREDKMNGGTLWKHTRRKLKHRKRALSGKAVNIPNKVSIDRRPPVVDLKERCGDWEADTIIGKDGKGAIGSADLRFLH